MFVEIHGTVQGDQMGQSTLTGEPKRAKGLHRAFVPTEVENSSSVGLPGEWASYVVDFVLYFNTFNIIQSKTFQRADLFEIRLLLQ